MQNNKKQEKSEKKNFADENYRETFWHSSAHLMAQAVKELFPETKLGIGPALEEGFYYDFDTEKPFEEKDLKAIEEKMKEIIKKDYRIEKKETQKKEAMELFRKRNEPYKMELIKELPSEKVSIYEQGNLADLCIGPHLESTGKIKAIKLTKLAAAYWKGDQKNKQLQRIYGISFSSQQELEEWEKQKEEALKRNHMKIGKELDLFGLFEESPGSAYFFPNGTIIWNELEEFMRKECLQKNYIEVKSPLLWKKKIWQTSGHWDYYKENMFLTEIEKEEYALKPMNCPAHIMYYKNQQHSYKELPIRIMEFGLVHRNELSGVLNGLMRVRKFVQDDAHIFCAKEQTQSEAMELIELTKKIYSTFGFKEYSAEISTMPEKYVGKKEDWKEAEAILEKTLKQAKIEYKINEGDGAFYGPKIDFKVKDSLKREWQLTTIQLDFNLPQRFELEYIDAQDKRQTPIMIHRTILGSLDRFMGVFTEHCAGKFPIWLSPAQCKIITVTDKCNDYAIKTNQKLLENGIRSESDLRNQTVSYKIRETQMQKIPYAIVIGEKEEQNNTIAIRDRENKQETMTIDNFLAKIKNEIKEKK